MMSPRHCGGKELNLISLWAVDMHDLFDSPFPAADVWTGKPFESLGQTADRLVVIGSYLRIFPSRIGIAADTLHVMSVHM